MTLLLASSAADDSDPPVTRRYAWIAFALVVGLMLSDYMSRQVINAVFPFLKAEWSLSDAQLGSLASVVALVVGVMTFPVSLLADRIGRVRSATMMALVWGLATIACGLSGNFITLFVARALVGLGEAGYGSAGGAILTSLFPRRLHSSVMGAFLAAALFGSVLGVAFGGVIAKSRLADGFHPDRRRRPAARSRVSVRGPRTAEAAGDRRTDAAAARGAARAVPLPHDELHLCGVGPADVRAGRRHRVDSRVT